MEQAQLNMVTSSSVARPAGGALLSAEEKASENCLGVREGYVSQD